MIPNHDLSKDLIDTGKQKPEHFCSIFVQLNIQYA